MRPHLTACLVLAGLATPALAHADGEPALAPLETAPTYAAAPAEGETKWNSQGMAVTGGVLVGVGVIALVAGGLLFASDSCDDGSGVEGGCFIDLAEPVGAANLIAGGAMLVTGAALFLAGAYQVPASDPRAPATTAELRVGPTRADVAVTF